jgi:hypothetical protein
MKKIILFAITLLFCSCNLIYEHKDYVGKQINYSIGISLQDNQGNDLVKGFNIIEKKPLDYSENGILEVINPEQYNIELKLSSPNKTSKTLSDIIFDNHIPSMWTSIPKGFNNYYLFHHIGLDTNDYDLQEKIIYRLKCPHIFGDQEVHEIVTYWTLDQNGNNQYAHCYRAEFNGKDIRDVKWNEDWKTSMINIRIN